MKVTKLGECGYESALKGLALSYYREGYDFFTWWTEARELKAAKQLEVLAFKGGGHNKALESIVVWVLITASRGWWQEMDTYRVGITKNSASSMHTILKEPVTKDNFEEGTSDMSIENLNNFILSKADITTVKNNIPEGYLQTRQVCLNYMALQNIIRQRRGHRLRYWDQFCDTILREVDHPELLSEAQR